MPGHLGILGRALRVIVEGLRRLGHDPDPLLAELGLREAALESLGTRVPLHVAFALFDAARATAGDPALGIHLAEATDASLWGTHGYAMLASPDLRSAYQWAETFHPLVAHETYLRLREDGRRASLQMGMRNGQPIHPLACEVMLTICVRLGWAITGERWAPLEVHFQHPAPTRRDEYHRMFGPRVLFEAPDNAVVLSASTLDRPNPSATPGLFEVLVRDAHDLLDSLPNAETTAEHVSHLVAEELDGGNPTAEHIAHRLAMSLRTLHRELAEEGTSFGQVLDDVRMQQAMRLLDDPRTNVGEIATRLGFARPGSFTRAFKRWTGTSPSAYRARANRAPDEPDASI